MEKTLDIIFESLTDEGWEKLKLKVESLKAFQAVKLAKAKRETAINFGDWIIKHDLKIRYDDKKPFCWAILDDEGRIAEAYNSNALYNIYLSGEWDEEEDDDDYEDDTLG